MSPIEQLKQIEERLEDSFVHDRFDTFNQLLSDRLVLLQNVEHLSGNEELFELAREQTKRWNDELGKRINHFRLRKMQAKTMGGYGKNTPQSGRVLNRSL